MRPVNSQPSQVAYLQTSHSVAECVMLEVLFHLLGCTPVYFSEYRVACRRNWALLPASYIPVSYFASSWTLLMETTCPELLR
jgi:hypothetical protein